MKPYRAIIWASFLLIIGEGIILSGFEFVPISLNPGAVLGDTTNSALEEIEAVKYPGSYYTPEMIESVSASVVVPAEEGEETTAPSETATEILPEEEIREISEEQENVDRLVEVLNTPSLGETPQSSRPLFDPESQASRVEQLMQKNERLYRERLIKELDEARKGLETFGDSIDESAL